MLSRGTATALAPEVRSGIARALEAFGSATRTRGARYARQGRVESIAVSETSVRAVVRGTERYQVVWAKRSPSPKSGWIGTCSCPVGISCKHAFAVATLLVGPVARGARDADDAELEGADLADLGTDDEILDPDDVGDFDEDAGAAWRPSLRPAASPRPPSPAQRERLDRAALQHVRDVPSAWHRRDFAEEILVRAGLDRDTRIAVLAGAGLHDPDPDVRCWRLARSCARATGAERLPPLLEPWLDRPDLAERLAGRERVQLRQELLDFAARAHAGPRRTLRVLLGFQRLPHGRIVLALDARVSSLRNAERSRTPAQLRQLFGEGESNGRALPPGQSELLALLVELLAAGGASSGDAARIVLSAGALRLLLDLAGRTEPVRWHDEIDPELARVGGVTPGEPVRFRAEAVRLEPDCMTRDGETHLELRATWPDGRSVPPDEVLQLGVGNLWRDDGATVVVSGGEIFAVAASPPKEIVDRFRVAGGLPLGPAERVAVLSRLAARWPRLAETLSAHTRLVSVSPVVTLDLREDDWLQVRVLARRRGEDAGATSASLADFEWCQDESWQRVEEVFPESLALVEEGTDASAARDDAGAPDAPQIAAVPVASPEATRDVWREAPDLAQVSPTIEWLRSTGASRGDRLGPGGIGVPWSDRATGFWLRLTNRRIEPFFAAWEARPPEMVFLGNERARRLLGRPPRTLPRVRVTASGVDFLAVSAEWETEGAELTAEDVAALRSTRTRFVRLRSGWVRRPEGDDGAIESALADLGMEIGEGEQRLTLWQLAGASAESLEALERIGADAETIRAVRRLRDRVSAFRGLPRVAVPRTLRAKLRPYQRDGLDFLAFVSDLGSGAILADDMGLGKTVQTLAWLEHLRKRDPGGGAALVVCPASVVHNWRREAERFAPSLRVLVLERGGARHALRAEIAQFDLVVTNYALLRRDAAAWQDVELRAAILDEAQNVKNPDAAVTRAAHGLRARHRLALTGTPLENRPLDVFSIASFVCPGYLGTRKRFADRFDRADLPAPRRVLLAARLRPLLLRRLKREVARDLPERIEERRDCELTPGQRRLYLAELAKSRDLVARLEKETDGLRRNRIAILAALTRLRQVCCHPALVGGREELGSGKLDTLLEILEPLHAEGHKVLVFSQFVAALRLVARALTDRGIPHHVLTGKTVDRDSVLRRFADDARPSAFLLSLKAGGTGLNLTSASYVILFDPWWNPAVEAQAIDRSHRIGQDRTVIAYRLIARGTIEEKIAQLQERKAELVRDLLGDGGAARGLTRDDLAYLLSPEDED